MIRLQFLKKNLGIQFILRCVLPVLRLSPKDLCGGFRRGLGRGWLGRGWLRPELERAGLRRGLVWHRSSLARRGNRCLSLGLRLRSRRCRGAGQAVLVKRTQALQQQGWLLDCRLELVLLLPKLALQLKYPSPRGNQKLLRLPALAFLLKL